MIKEFIGTGKTTEDAILAAKAGLNAPLTADVKIEIVQMPKKGFLGIGSKDAQVKASYDDGKKEKRAPKKKAPKKQEAKKQAPNKPEKKQSAPAPKKEQAKKSAPAPKKEQAEPKKDYPESVNLEYAKAYLEAIVKGLQIEDVKIDASYNDGVVTMDLECGEDYGIVIGRRGETLDSIQYLLSLAIKKESNGYARVSINIGNYREKRNETLRNLAQKNAKYVLRTGRRYTFEPMNPYERRVIHTTIQEIEGVESRSIGYNQDRRVVIEPVGGVKSRSNGSRGGYNRGGNKPAPTKKAERPSLSSFGKIDD